MEAALGHNLLSEVEEMSLHDLLMDVRALTAATPAHHQRRPHHPPPLPLPPKHPLSPLAAIAARYFRSTQSPTIAVSAAGSSSGTGPGAFVTALVAALVAGGEQEDHGQGARGAKTEETAEEGGGTRKAKRRRGRFAVLVVDPWHRFDATALVGVRERDLEHVYVLQPPLPLRPGAGSQEMDDDQEDYDKYYQPDDTSFGHGDVAPPDLPGHVPKNWDGNDSDSSDDSNPKDQPIENGDHDLGRLAAQAREWLAYAPHGSRRREFWGTILLGGGSGSDPGGTSVRADVVCGWKGWLRIERARVDGFAVGTSAEEALARRAVRQEVVERAGWRAVSVWGEFGLSRS